METPLLAYARFAENPTSKLSKKASVSARLPLAVCYLALSVCWAAQSVQTTSSLFASPAAENGVNNKPPRGISRAGFISSALSRSKQDRPTSHTVRKCPGSYIHRISICAHILHQTYFLAVPVVSSLSTRTKTVYTSPQNHHPFFRSILPYADSPVNRPEYFFACFP